MSSSSSLGVERVQTWWHIAIKGGENWPDEHLDLSSDEAHSYWFEGGIVIQTKPTGFGDFHLERVIPWAQVIEWSRANTPRDE